MVRQWLSGLKLRPPLSSGESPLGPRQRRRRAGQVRRAWLVEGLEGRVLLSGSPTVYTVNSTGSGSSGTGTSGTLPYVISQANINTNTAGSEIEFDPSIFTASSSPIILGSTLTLSETAGPEMIDGTGATVFVSGNSAVEVFSIESQVTATLSNLTIENGSTSASGGGILNAGSLTISDSTLNNNTAGNVGGGIDNDGGTLTVSNSLISNSEANNGGGGIYIAVGTVTIATSTLEDNDAGTASIVGSGGGIANAATLTITNSTFADDGASADGGGIDNTGTLTVTNSTFADNGAITAGGGIDNTGTLTTVNVTIADNEVGSTGTGGGLEAASGTAALTNTIVAANSAGTVSGAPASDISGSVTGTYNLIGIGGSGGLTNGTGNNIVLTSLTNLDLSPLGEYGGPTDTVALIPGSPAIGKGTTANYPGTSTPITTDQRGFPLDSPPDIGAFQTGPLTVESTGGSVETEAAELTLAGAVILADLIPGANTIQFDKAVFATSQTITLTSGTLELSDTSGQTTITGPSAGLTISGDSAVQVFDVETGVTATLSGLTISSGSASSGGGIDNAGILTVTDVVITSNFAATSGGGVTNSGTMFIEESNVAHNTALVSNGGGIDNSGTMTIVGSTIANNSVVNTNPSSLGNGGGIENTGELTIQSSTISSNSDTGGDGGGIDNNGGTLALTNTTVAGNTAGSGGGLSQDQNTTLTVISTTIADNVATSGSGDGGGLNLGGDGSASLYDTIVARNTSGGSASDLGGNDVSSASAYNLIGTGGSGGLNNGTNGNLAGVADPVLGSLASNGGSTQTIAVLPGSPAIGKGASTISGVTIPNTDQRGVTRTSYDIGAFQDQGFTITIVPGDSSQSAKVNTAFANPLAVIVTSPDDDPVQGGIVDYTAPGTGASAVLSAGTATIGANGQAQVTATANGQTGSYTVTASALGATSPVSFAMTNIPTTPIITLASVTGISVLWGSQTAALVIPSSSGGLLLPSGRGTDIPWLGIDVLQITLSQAEPLTSSNITLRSVRGINYQVVGVSANGSSYAVFLSRAMTASDRITLTIAGAGLTTFTGQLNVLPGDFNDNGVVNRQDYYDVRAEKLGLGPASSFLFADINGDGVVNTKDLKLVRQRFGLRLPRQTTPRPKAVETRTREAPAVRIVRDHPVDFRHKSRFARVRSSWA